MEGKIVKPLRASEASVAISKLISQALGELGILLFLFAIILISACKSSQASLGVACNEIRGKVDFLHLGREELDHGFPYTMGVQGLASGWTN